MIAWVVDAARSATRVDDVAVVTDHPEIARAAEAAGARAVVSGAPADSGTDRIGHLLAMDPVAAQARIIVNVQGDEPLLEPEAIDAAVRLLDEDLDSDPATEIATLVRPLRSGERADDPHLVKVAVAGDGRALSFSRDPIPHGAPRIHIGLYAYRRTAFDRFVEVAPSPLERLERLEQLRALDLGIVVRCVEFDSRSIAVDRPEDLTRVEAVLEELAGP